LNCFWGAATSLPSFSSWIGIQVEVVVVVIIIVVVLVIVVVIVVYSCLDMQ